MGVIGITRPEGLKASMAGFSEWILTNENGVRLWFFLGGFATFFILGLVVPFRAVPAKAMLARWFNNSILTFFNSFFFQTHLY